MKYLKTYESHSNRLESIKQDIIDLMSETMDNSLFDVDVDLYDYAKGFGDLYGQTRRRVERPQYNAGLRVTIHKTRRTETQENGLVKDDLERVLDYLRSQGITIVNHEYKYSNNIDDSVLPYKSIGFPKSGWMKVRLATLLWI